MSLRRSFNPCFGFSRRTGAITVSSVLVVFAFVFTVLCFAQLSVGDMLPGGVQAGFAIASILQAVLVALGSMIIFASWKENTRLIRFSAYLTATHLAINMGVLACLVVIVAYIMPCGTGRFPCPRLVVAKPAWYAFSGSILFAQLYLSIVVFCYFVHLEDHSRRPYTHEISSRSISTPPSHHQDRRRLLSNSEPYSTVELSAVESRSTTRSFSMPGSETGYGGGMRTYEEAEENEKARLRRAMEDEENQVGLFPVPSSSETTILTPLGLQWREGDLPPYAS